MQNTETQWMQTLTGASIRIKIPGAETDNRLTIIDFIEPAHSSPPVFTKHEFVEIFCVISGRLCFQFLDESRFELATGESITCPSYKPHSFWNETDEPVQLQLVCSPAGLDQFFVESDALLKNTDLKATDLEAKRRALRNKYGLQHIGSPPENLS